MVIDILKCEGQWPSSRHMLAILMIFFKHILSLIIHLRCLYESLSRLGVEELLHLAIELINSSSEKAPHDDDMKDGISSRMSSSMCQSEAMLNDKYSVNQRSFISRHEQSLYLTASIAGSLCLWTQPISSQGPLFLLEISWILRLKNDHFVSLTVFLNCF